MSEIDNNPKIPELVDHVIAKLTPEEYNPFIALLVTEIQRSRLIEANELDLKKELITNQGEELRTILGSAEVTNPIKGISNLNQLITH